jgi:hypothetical protein
VNLHGTLPRLSKNEETANRRNWGCASTKAK